MQRLLHLAPRDTTLCRKDGTIEISAKYRKHNASIPDSVIKGVRCCKNLEKNTLGIGLKG
jgi:hypothetical protein